jgi:hypothetical protein
MVSLSGHVTSLPLTAGRLPRCHWTLSLREPNSSLHTRSFTASLALHTAEVCAVSCSSSLPGGRPQPRAAMSFFSSKKATPPPVPYLAPPVPRSSPTIDATTVISLLAVLALLGGAYAASLRVLPKTAAPKTRVLFIWHLFDALVHFVFEGSYLWNCFFVSYSLPTTFSAASRNHPHITLFTPPDVYWLGKEDLLYGANYGTTPFSRLWQEYAKADKRWGGVDLTVVSLEILTVFVAGPLACWICWLLSKDERKGVLKKWFWMSMLATGEIYGES